MSTTFFNASPDQALRARAKATWEAGDFGVIAKYSENVAEEFMARLSLRPGARVLDLACGSGNLAMIAARKGCETTGVDLASNLIAQARARAAAERLQIDFRETDVEELPFGDSSFDYVVSKFGVMFGPHPARAATELLRVCKPGGVIALACWTSEGFIGESFRRVAKHVPAPASCVSPLLWGDEATALARLGQGVRDVTFTRHIARLKYPFNPAQTVDFFRQFYGPTVRAFAALDAEGQKRLHADLEQLYRNHNQATDGGTEVHAEYLQTIATRS